MEGEVLIEDKCQCCLIEFEYSQTLEHAVTPELQSIFLDLFRTKLSEGKICFSCYSNLNAVKKFKLEIVTNRKNLRLLKNVKRESAKSKDCSTSESLLTSKSKKVQVKEDDLSDKVSNLSRISQSKQKLAELRTKASQKESAENSQTVLDHIQTPTKSPKSECPLCKKNITARALSTHLKTHDSHRERSFLCEICSKTYLNKHELIVHRRNHLNIRPFVCDFDNKSFTSKNNLSKHIQTQHLNLRRAVDFKVCCPVCEKLFPFRSKMIEHYKKAHPGGRHDGIKVNPATNHFHCEKCGSEFLTKFRIDNHVCIIGAQSSSSDNKCPVCSLRCLNRLDMIKHLHEHGEKLDKNKWRCKVCKAIVQDKIAVHVENTHSNENVICNLCGKQLKNKKSLRQHIFLSHQNGYEIRKKRKIQ